MGVAQSFLRRSFSPSFGQDGVAEEGRGEGKTGTRQARARERERWQQPYYMPCSICGQDGHNRRTCTMPGHGASPVVDPQLGDLYRRLENTLATRDMFAQEGLPTDTVDATIEEIRRQIRDVDAKMKAAAPSQPAASAAGAPSSSAEQACWFGFECNRPGCAYHHPDGRQIDCAWTPSAAGVPSPGPPIGAARVAGADDVDGDEARLRQALELSRLASTTNTKDVLPVPPEWHRFVDKDLMVTIKVATGLVAIDSRMPTRPDLDGHIVLEGTPAAVREAKQLLGPPIAKARQQQRKDAPELLALLEMGYERADATRALVETCPRGTVAHGQRVQQALEWLVELHGEEAGDADQVAESEDQRPIVAVPAPVPRRAPTPELGPEPQPQPEPAPVPVPVPAPVQYRIDITGKRRAGLIVGRAAMVQRFYEDIGNLCGVPHTELRLTLPDGSELDPMDTTELGESGVLPGTTVTVADRQPEPAAALAPAPVVSPDLDLETGSQPEAEHGVVAGDGPPPPIPPFPGVDGMPDDEPVEDKPTTPEPLVVAAPTAGPAAVPATTPGPADVLPLAPEPAPAPASAAASSTSASTVSSVGVRVDFTSLANARAVPQSPTEDVDGIDESTFSKISYVEAGIEPKLSCFTRDDPGYKHVELTQGIIMWTVLTIIDRHGPHLRDIEVQIPGERSLVCKACQAEHTVPVKRCTDDGMKLLPEDFRFRLGGAGGCPNPYPGTLQAVAAVQHAIETARGSVGFRIKISTHEPDPTCIEQWAVVLQGTASRENLQEPRKTQAIVAMRTLHSFSRLVCRQSSGALQFEISRLHPSEVSAAAKRAVAVPTSFGCVTVDLEYVAEGSVAADIAAPVEPEPEPEPEVEAADGQNKGHEQEQDRRQEKEEEELRFHVPNPASWKDIDIPSDDVEDGDIAAPGAMVGRYQVTQYLGKGQFGLVWKATVRDRRRDVDVDVAIKTMDRAKFQGARNKILVQNEIKSMQAVRHKNVVQLFEPLYSESHVMMVLEFCETDLKKYMHAKGARGLPSRAPLSEAETKNFMRDFAAGLQELRAHDIIHRDLKDENLLITHSAADGREVLKIADFGFAKQLVDLTATYTQVGSPAYMAPEVLALHNRALRDGTGLGLSDGYDAKADLWSVGCIMYGMLCKRLVFSDDVRNQADLVNELAREMRDGTQKTLPEFVECEDGRGFNGPASQYNQGAEESPASRECRLILAVDAGVADDRVSIIGGHEIAALRPQGQVVVKYRRAVDVSVECRDLLGQLLQHHPQRRIEWPEFFKHPWLR